MTMVFRRWACLLFSALAVFVFLGLSSSAKASMALQPLMVPGTHAIMRHAIAPGTGDPGNFTLGDCNTQRNLDSRGREQAHSIGNELKNAGIKFDGVLTSQWCRCKETARLLDVGDPEEFPALNSFFGDRSTAEQQTSGVRAFLSSLPADRRFIFVTHQVNITALTGRVPSSGEILFIRANKDGEIKIVGEFLLSR